MKEQGSFDLARTILCISYLEEKMGSFYSVLSRISDEEEIKLAFNYLAKDSNVRKELLRHIAKLLASSLKEGIEGCEDIVGSKLIEALSRYEDIMNKIEKGAVGRREILNSIKWHVSFSGPEYLIMVNLIAFSFILKDRLGVKQMLKAMADGRKSRIEVLERIIELMRSS
ncbi:MAG: hypothetical protein DRN92_06355 [Thermoproteota archaeon]|nr:MAG: hypothetical protein DRN92_06355 [Candidatus Korarchaeota archaeon]